MFTEEEGEHRIQQAKSECINMLYASLYTQKAAFSCLHVTVSLQ